MRLSGDLSLDSLRLVGLASVGELLGRWRAALTRCLPPRMRRWLAIREPVLVVLPRGDDAVLMRELGEERELVGALDLRTGGPVSTTVAPPKRGWKETRVELPASAVLLRTINLPVQVKDNLRKVLAFEIDRLTPFQPADVRFDARVTGTAARGAKLIVSLAVCRRDQVADWLVRLQEGGTQASRLTWAGAWPDANLLLPEERPRPRRFGSLITASLVLALVMLITALMASPLWQKQQQQQDLERQLRRLRIQAEEVSVVRQQLEEAREGSTVVLKRKLEQPRVTDLLRDLTDRLPDDTWAQTLNVNNGEVDLRGESGQATELIGLLAGVPGISGASFRSPVMQVGATGQERFHIAFTYSRPKPQ